jgi:hypothetical protein
MFAFFMGDVFVHSDNCLDLIEIWLQAPYPLITKYLQ